MNKAVTVFCLALAMFMAKAVHAYDLPPLNLGFTSFMDGGPPAGPGWYFQNYTQYYTAHRMNDHNGDEIPFPDTNIDVLVDLLQVVYQSDMDFLGGQWGVNFILPFAAPTIDFSEPGPFPEANNAGAGDLLVGPLLQWGPYMGEQGPVFMHRVELQTIWPTGKYDSNKELNPGSNYFSFNPYWAATAWLTPEWTVSWRLHYLWNAENDEPNRGFAGADDTRAGQAVHVNFTTSYEVIPKVLRLGINGYFLKQTTDTQVDGVSVPDRRESAVAIGPGLLYSFSQDHHIFVNGYFELDTENRPQGSSMLIRYVGHF